jgi:tellurite resistance protein TerC
MLHHISEMLFLILFIAGILSILLLDLLVIGRKSHVLSFREAGAWVAVWVSLAFLFYLFLLWKGELIHGIKNMDDLAAVINSYAYEMKLTGNSFEENLMIFRKNISTNYLTGYFIEETLSLDNLFVILMILTGFSVSTKNYKKVLFWGILGAIVLRSIFIFAGYQIIKRFDWVLLIFGAFLVFTGIRYMFKKEHEKTDIREHFLFRVISKNFPVYPRFVMNRFFILKEGKGYITPLFVVLILIEFTDLIFAVDSIPAIFSVTTDPYIVFFSNIFAIIGLRSLFFFLANINDRFRFLKYGISVLLTFVGAKLLLKDFLHDWGYKSQYSLYFIILVILISIGLSLLFPAGKVKTE